MGVAFVSIATEAQHGAASSVGATSTVQPQQVHAGLRR